MKSDPLLTGDIPMRMRLTFAAIISRRGFASQQAPIARSRSQPPAPVLTSSHPETAAVERPAGLAG
jgi:hypothetical protein